MCAVSNTSQNTGTQGQVEAAICGPRITDYKLSQKQSIFTSEMYSTIYVGCSGNQCNQCNVIKFYIFLISSDNFNVTYGYFYHVWWRISSGITVQYTAHSVDFLTELSKK